MITKFTTKELIAELIKRYAWLNGSETASMLNIKPTTLRKKNSRKAHRLVRYKDGENGRVKYLVSDVLDELKRQQVPV